ncbi:DNA polymerase I, partial [candidate division KSB1 bacterium]|nr:DNA polymerase I [candidate division KSB1 bacterium]
IEENEHNSLEVYDVFNRLKPVLLNPEIKKSGQNIKYDLLVLSNYGIVVEGVNFDTMVASYILDPEKRQHNLDSLALEFFNYKKIPTTELIGKGKNQISMSQVPIEKVAEYAAEDADMTWRLKELFEKKLKDSGLEKLFHEVEMPLVKVLMQIEKNGVSIDVPFLKQMEKQFEQDMAQLLKRVEEMAGSSINLNSPKQLGDLLFKKMKLPTARKTKTGYSTDVTVLEGLAKKYELPRVILDYRQLSKLQSTYVTALPKLVNPRTKRIHTSYNQTVATTGRLSSSDPNLQNIPIRTEMGREIRRAFIPGDKDRILLDADYSQIELRIMAHLSGDATLRDSFIKGEDIHRRTAALILNLPPDNIDDEQRRQAKAINFGIIYGMGAFGLASRLDISQSEAQIFIDAYFTKYPGVKNFMEEVVKKARKDGYVSTMLGRTRRLPDILSDNRRRREFAERIAINTPIQGTAADMIKLAMLHIQNRINREKLNIKMIMQVHDELVFEVLRDEVDYAKKIVQEEMENALKLEVPIKVDVGVGENWLEAH